MNKRFHISDVLSITTGHLVSFRHMDGVYEIMNFVLQDDLTTLGLAAMGDTVREELKRQFPQLEEVKVPDDLNESNYREWVESLYLKYGEYFSVATMKEAREKRTLQDDIAYAHSVNPEMEIIVAQVDDV